MHKKEDRLNRKEVLFWHWGCRQVSFRGFPAQASFNLSFNLYTNVKILNIYLFIIMISIINYNNYDDNNWIWNITCVMTAGNHERALWAFWIATLSVVKAVLNPALCSAYLPTTFLYSNCTHPKLLFMRITIDTIQLPASYPNSTQFWCK